MNWLCKEAGIVTNRGYLYCVFYADTYPSCEAGIVTNRGYLYCMPCAVKREHTEIVFYADTYPSCEEPCEAGGEKPQDVVGLEKVQS